MTDQRQKNPYRMLGTVFTAMGVLALLLGLTFYLLQRQDLASRQPVVGSITALESSTAYVDYTAGGQAYSGVRLNYYSSSMYVGQRITLYIDPDRPGQPAVRQFLMGFIFALLGLIFACIGSGLLYYQRRKRRRRQYLLQNGRPITAQVTEVQRDARIHVNGRSPWVVWAQYVDPGSSTIYQFKSDSLWADPTALVGSTVRVYVDRSDYRRYWVNTSFLDRYHIVG